MFAKIKQVGIILWAIIASAAAVIGFILLNRRSKEDEQTIENHAAKKHETNACERSCCFLVTLYAEKAIHHRPLPARSSAST
ncbi:hypothetical protein E4N72_03980 [Treponema vincentii]|uniref:hypothetical protein n=1 Tax=Treponema vincentii TaxID=69710 RepID=UPI0020A32563|nr:hypothetical protein [Treponema vincentii]UTC45787.1 hypothetical protein E4N72_03980 [Treponema vincentii]